MVHTNVHKSNEISKTTSALAIQNPYNASGIARFTGIKESNLHAVCDVIKCTTLVFRRFHIRLLKFQMQVHMRYDLIYVQCRILPCRRIAIRAVLAA